MSFSFDLSFSLSFPLKTRGGGGGTHTKSETSAALSFPGDPSCSDSIHTRPSQPPAECASSVNGGKGEGERASSPSSPEFEEANFEDEEISSFSASKASSILSRYQSTVGLGFSVPFQYSGRSKPAALRAQSIRATRATLTAAPLERRSEASSA